MIDIREFFALRKSGEDTFSQKQKNSLILCIHDPTR